MQAVEIRKELQDYIDNSDEKLLKLMLALAKEYNENDESGYEFTDEDIKEFDARRQARLNGETVMYTWEQAKEMITGKKPLP